MNAIVYNVALLLGLVLVGVGVGLRFGVPDAFMTLGALILGLTAFGAFISTRGR